MAAPNAHAPVGSGGRFAAMVAKGMSPALAASIGRKKYGNAKFSKMAAKGKAASEETGETGPDNEVAELAHKRTRAKMGAGARH